MVKVNIISSMYADRNPEHKYIGGYMYNILLTKYKNTKNIDDPALGLYVGTRVMCTIDDTFNWGILCGNETMCPVVGIKMKDYGAACCWKNTIRKKCG